MSPTARAFQLFSKVAVTGETVLTATVAGDTTDVRAYAATNSGGTALVLFNQNETASQQVMVTLSGKASSSSVHRHHLRQGHLRPVGFADRHSAGPGRDEHLGPANYHQHGRADPASDPDSHSLEHERGHHPMTERKVRTNFVPSPTAGYGTSVPYRFQSGSKRALDEWTVAAAIKQGKIFRAVARTGKGWGDRHSPNVVWYVVKACCETAGLEHVARFAKNLRQAVPQQRRGDRADSIPARPCIGSDHGTVPRL